jgi:AcrR family transcriptional regulator
MKEETNKPGRLQRRIAMFWGDRDRPQRGPKPSLTLQQIAGKAVEIADAEGLSSVTMQRLASELGFSTMALYRYVATKNDLVALMVEHALEEMSLEAEKIDDWRASLTAIAHSLLAQFHLHPWMPTVTIDGPPEGPKQLEWMERALSATESIGLPEQDRMDVVLTISSYVRGHAQVSVGMIAAERETGESLEEHVNGYIEHLISVSSEHYPSLHRSIKSGLFSEDDHDLFATFDFGLQRLLDGLEVYVQSRNADRCGDSDG